MKHHRILALAWIGFLGCSTISTQTDWNQKANFSNLKTYAWTTEGALFGEPKAKQTPLTTDTILDQRVKNATNRTLAAKDYALINDKTPPDFFVRYHVSAKDKVQVYSSHGYTGNEWHSGRNVDVYNYVAGTLILDVLAPDQKTLMWRGWAEAEILPNQSPEKRDAMVQEAVNKMLKKFPPKP